jgi:hypothetical protein
VRRGRDEPGHVEAQWPLGRGFERYYGFLGGETNQWYPDLVYDNHPVQQPKSPEDGYHLTVDLTDKAIEFVQDAKAIAPDKPFFLYYCPGAAHAPHHAPKEWAGKYQGKFDMGYEAYREQVFQRQQQLGIIPEGAELSPINPYTDTTSHDGKPWSELDTVRPWDSLSDDEQRLFARMAEVYAGFLSHADHELGRLLDYLEESGQLDNTIIVLVSDNGSLLPRRGGGARVGCSQHPQPLLHVATEMDIETPEAGGVIFSQGSRFGGHALYVKDGRLKYVYNLIGKLEQIVESNETIPSGHVVLSASFDRQGDTMPTQGTLSLYVRDAKVAEDTIRTQPGKFGLGGGGLVVGRSGAEPIAHDYAGESPWPFLGGTIKRVFIDVSGESFVDLAAEARAAFARQ